MSGVRALRTTFKKAGRCRLSGFFTPASGEPRHVLGEVVHVRPGDVLEPGMSLWAIEESWPRLYEEMKSRVYLDTSSTTR